MVGVAGRSGKPPRKSAGLPAESGVRVDEWPWEFDPEGWTREKIWNHIADRFHLWGITQNYSDVNFLTNLADYHYRKMVWQETFDTARSVGDQVSMKEAETRLQQLAGKINEIMTKFGVGKNPTIRPRNVQNGSDVISIAERYA